jgi:tetratricopeptide (TPR) repeat protein
MGMLKSCIILLSSVVFLFASIEEGDKYYNKQEYNKALSIYIDEYKKTKQKDVKFRIMLSYIRIGDNFFNIQSYQKAKEYYNQAYKIGSIVAKKKLSLVYEKEGDLYKKGNRYEKAYHKYLDAKKLGNDGIIEKIEQVKALADHQKRLKNDTRKIVTSTSPLWTKAIGRLIIPTQKSATSKKIEKCSATLINFENMEASKVIISASHCLKEFDSHAGALRFLIKSKTGKVIQKYAKVIKDSQFDIKRMKSKSDYAILLLSSHINKKDVSPLIVSDKSFLQLQKFYNNTYGSLGGFSSDVGNFGSSLSYDPMCRLNYYNKVYAKSNCSGFKGASGGPVVLNVPFGNETKSYFVGVVSHFKNDTFEEIFFAPHNIFYNDIKDAIIKFNY